MGPPLHILTTDNILSNILSVVSSLAPRVLCVRLVGVLARGVLVVPWVPIFLTHIMRGPLVEHHSKCHPSETKVFSGNVCLSCLCFSSGGAPGGAQYCPQGWGGAYQQWQAPNPHDPSECPADKFPYDEKLFYLSVYPLSIHQIKQQQTPMQHGQPTMHNTMGSRRRAPWRLRTQAFLLQQRRGTRASRGRPRGGSQTTQRPGRSTTRRWEWVRLFIKMSSPVRRDF